MINPTPIWYLYLPLHALSVPINNNLHNMAIKKRVICGSVCIALFLGLFLFTLIGLESLIDSVVLDGVVLAPQTMDTWGENPGKLNQLIMRNFTFYNLTNPRAFLYRNQKPVFTQITNFLIRECSKLFNIVYSPDRSYITYSDWEYFPILNNSRNLNDTINVLNLAPLGFWSQLGEIPLPSLAIQGFGGLFTAMNETIKMQAIGQGVQGQFLANYTSFHALCSMMQIQDTLCHRLYYDPLYGLGDQNNYEVWVDFSYYNNTDSEFLLYEYFNLKRSQLRAFDVVFERWCRSVDTILDNWYCGGKCNNYDLTILQLSDSGLTRNPPSGDATDSICLNPLKQLRQNLSCQGYPELYSYYHYQHPGTNKKLTFSKETVSKLFSPYNGTLLNVGNLTRLFAIGTAYDNQKTSQNLQKLKAQTYGETDEHTIVIWQYVKYFTNEFVLQSKDKGTKKIAGLGGVFSAAISQSFTQFADWIMDQLLALKVAEKIPNCVQFIEENPQLAPRAFSLCQGINQQNYRSYSRLIQPCNNEYYADMYKDKNDLLAYQMGLLCNNNNEDGPSMLDIITQAHAFIADHYHCQDPQRCTGYELALKQFIYSNITMNPLKNTVKMYPQSLTGHKWNPELQEWQYRHVLNEIYGDAWIDKKDYNDTDRLRDLLSYDKLFNGPMVQNLTLVEDPRFFQELYYFENKTLLMDYIRFVTIEVGFGGLTQKRSAYQLLFGYQDPFLKTLKEMDPMLGGDPSIQTMIALNEPNSTMEQAAADIPQSVYTGYGDPYRVHVYRTYNGKEYITYNHTYFDGYKVITEFISPYAKPTPLGGTDASQEKAMSTPNDNQYVYIDSLYRVGEVTYVETVKKFGFDALKYEISKKMLASSKDNPQNANFYQQYTSLMNLSFMGLPLLASKSHFLDADPKWNTLIEIYDESGKHQQLPSKYDDTEIIIQPKSGATFTATIYLQTNVHLQEDLLFTNQARMMPVFAIFRSGNMTQEIADQVLGDLKIALAAPTKLILLSVFGIIFTVFCMIACRLKQRRRTDAGSLLSSTHEEQRLQDVDKNSDIVD